MGNSSNTNIPCQPHPVGKRKRPPFNLCRFNWLRLIGTNRDDIPLYRYQRNYIKRSYLPSNYLKVIACFFFLTLEFHSDFMSGPSSAPRLSMPEPHDVLGVIKGVIIRDAQGNIGLSQYQFSTM